MKKFLSVSCIFPSYIRVERIGSFCSPNWLLQAVTAAGANSKLFLINEHFSQSCLLWIRAQVKYKSTKLHAASLFSYWLMVLAKNWKSCSFPSQMKLLGPVQLNDWWFTSLFNLYLSILRNIFLMPITRLQLIVCSRACWSFESKNCFRPESYIFYNILLLCLRFLLSFIKFTNSNHSCHSRFGLCNLFQFVTVDSYWPRGNNSCGHRNL